MLEEWNKDKEFGFVASFSLKPIIPIFQFSLHAILHGPFDPE
jgi:hypothetical protein